MPIRATSAKSAWWTRSGDPTITLSIKNGKGPRGNPANPTAVTVASGQRAGTIDCAARRRLCRAQLDGWNQANNLVLALMFGAIVFYAINLAKRKDIFLAFPGLDAVDEAIRAGHGTGVSRCCMMTGAHDMNDPSTIAAADYPGTRRRRKPPPTKRNCWCRIEPITMAVCQEITKQAYMEAGNRICSRDDANFFYHQRSFSYSGGGRHHARRGNRRRTFMGSYFAGIAAAD